MDIGKIEKISTQKAADIYQHFEIQEEAKALLTMADLSSIDFLKEAINNKYYFDAMKFIAHGLSRKDAILWGYLEVTALNQEVNTTEQQILTLVQQWLDVPSEKNRFAIAGLAEKLEYKTAISWLGMAVFWSGGSIIEPGKPTVEPDPYLTAKAIVGALHLVTVLPDPSKLTQKLLAIVKQGLVIANGEL